MATRIGIEVTPVGLRIVEVMVSPAWSRRWKGPNPLRVRKFAVLPAAGSTTSARLASLGRRPAAVVVWGARSEYRELLVNSRSLTGMRSEAHELAGGKGGGVRILLDVAPAPARARERSARRSVVIAFAAADDIRRLIAPLTEAGVRVRSVVTPALALMSVAKLRRALVAPGALEAYIALEETATALALVRDGLLLGARELAWGYRAGNSPSGEVRGREEIGQRLADDLVALLGAIGQRTGGVTQVCVCGSLPDLRTTTVPLMERLDIEVETLDSLFGIDPAHLPEPADQFREDIAKLQLARAVACDIDAPINLLREEQLAARRRTLQRAAAVSGIVAGLGGAGWVAERGRREPSTSLASRGPAIPAPRATSPRPPPSPSAPSRPPALPPAPASVAASSRPSAGTPGASTPSASGPTPGKPGTAAASGPGTSGPTSGKPGPAAASGPSASGSTSGKSIATAAVGTPSGGAAPRQSAAPTLAAGRSATAGLSLAVGASAANGGTASRPSAPGGSAPAIGRASAGPSPAIGRPRETAATANRASSATGPLQTAAPVTPLAPVVPAGRPPAASQIVAAQPPAAAPTRAPSPVAPAPTDGPRLRASRLCARVRRSCA